MSNSKMVGGMVAETRFQIEYINDATDQQELAEALKRAYEKRYYMRRDNYLHVLSSASRTRHGYQGYAALFAGEEPLSKLVVGKEFGAVSCVYRIPRDKTAVMKDILKTGLDQVKDSILQVSDDPHVLMARNPHGMGMIRDVDDPIELRSQWMAYVPVDSPSSFLAVVKEKNVENPEETSYCIVVQLALREAVRTIRMRAKMRGMTVAQFYDSTTYKRLELYTRIAADRLAFRFSKLFDLDCPTTTKFGAENEEYDDCCYASQVMHFNLLSEIPRASPPREFVALNHAVNLETLRMQKADLFVQKRPMHGFAFFSPTDREKGVVTSRKTRFAIVPTDIGIHGYPDTGRSGLVEDRRILTRQPYVAKIFDSEVMKKKHADKQWEDTYSMDPRAVRSRHLHLVLLIPSSIDPANIPIDHLEKQTREGTPVLIPKNHKFIHFFNLAVVAQNSEELASEIVMDTAKENPFYFAFPREDFQRMKELVESDESRKQQLEAYSF